MVFAHDTDVALQTAIHLVNSAEPPDTLTTVAELDAFLTTFSFTGAIRRDAAEVESVRELRPELRALLLADRDDAVDLINRWLAEAEAVPQLVRHEDYDWHLHAVDAERPLAERIRVETAMAMIDVVRLGEHSRIGVCAADDCSGLVLDLSRNRSRRFCSTTCGNRIAAAAYRARQAQEQDQV